MHKSFFFGFFFLLYLASLGGCQTEDTETQPTTPASASAFSIPSALPTAQTTASPVLVASPLPSASPLAQNSSDIQPGQRFSLKQGESVQFQNLTLSFSELLRDSRCPVDAQCIWAGEVQVRLSVTENTRTVALDFTLPGQEIKSLNEKYQVQLLSVARPATEIGLHLLKTQ